MAVAEAEKQAATESPDDSGELEGTDPEKGKLFEVPRVAILIDEADPDRLRLAFSGSIDIDRNDATQIQFYNSLKAGFSRNLQLDVHVAGAKNSHRRDNDGNVDAIVQTKSVIVTDVHYEAP